MKVTVGEVIYEGTPEELKELMGKEEKPEVTKPWVSAFSVGGFVKKDSEADSVRIKLELLKRKALKEKWAKIGREPGEYKVGDIVYGSRRIGKHKGEIVTGTVEDVDTEENKGNLGIRSFGSDDYYSVDVIGLIAPVGSRFDKESE